MTSLTIDFNKANYFESFIYHDGASHQVRLTADGVAAVKRANIVKIIARLSNATDILNLVLLLDGINGVCQSLPPWKMIFVVLPYLPFSRADRRFVEGDCAGLDCFLSLLHKETYRFHLRIVTLDVHNVDAIGHHVDNVEPTRLIHRAIIDTAELSPIVTVLFPDKGASTRYELPDYIENNTHRIQLTKLYCSKTRDAVTGKLLSFDVPVRDIPTGFPALIIDDIGDGCGTFIGIADEIGKAGGMIADLNLWVTHGIFSKGFTQLEERFDKVFTTNSREQNGPQGFLTVYDSMPLLLGV